MSRRVTDTAVIRGVSPAGCVTDSGAHPMLGAATDAVPTSLKSLS